jgi:hypothetical protein
MMEKLIEFLDKDPFVAFRIVVTSGHAYDVHSTYQVAIGQTKLEYCYPRSDKSATVRFNQIVAFETMDQTAAS